MKKKLVYATKVAMLFLVVTTVLTTGCDRFSLPELPLKSAPAKTASPQSAPTSASPQAPPISAKLSLMPLASYETLGSGQGGQPLQHTYIIARNGSKDYLQPMFTLRQYDEQGNFLQEVSRQGDYIAPRMTWATYLNKMTEKELTQWRIVDIKTMKIPRDEGELFVGRNNLGLSDMKTETINNINGIPILYLIGKLSNIDPTYRSTPTSVTIQVFKDLSDKGDYVLVGFAENVKPIPPPEESVQFKMPIKSDVSIVGDGFIKGIISIKAYYPK